MPNLPRYEFPTKLLRKRQKVSSRFVGVSYIGGPKKPDNWSASITHKGKRILLGRYSKEWMAATAFEVAWSKLK